jgi:hypothetical protein
MFEDAGVDLEAYIANDAKLEYTVNRLVAPDLSILATPFIELRYWIHLFLNVLLNGNYNNIFGQPGV